MDEKTVKNADLAQQLEVGRTAEERGNWRAAIAAYTAALDMPALSGEEAYALRERRAHCYGQLGELEKQIADLTRMNRLLSAKAESRVAEVAVINSIQEGLAEQLDFQAIVDLVGDKLRDVLQIGNVSIIWLDRERLRGVPLYVYVDGERVEQEPWNLGETGRAAVKHRQPILWRTPSEADEKGIWTREGEKEALSGLFVPIAARDEAIGTIRLEDYENEYAFDESVLRLVRTIAASMGAALENARLFDETNQRAAELAIINSVQEGLVSKLDQQAIYDLVGDKIREIFDAQVVMIFSYDLEREWVHGRYMWEKGERFEIGGGPLQGMKRHLVETKRPLLVVEDFEATREKFGMQIPAGEASKSGLWVPLIVGGRVTGDVSIQNVDREHAFDEADVRLLTTLASSMSVALENARLFDETNQRNDELAIINSIQQGLSSKLEMGAIIDLVGDKLGEIFEDMDAVQINLIDQEKNLIHIPYCVEGGERHEHGARQPWGFRKHVIESGEPLIINEKMGEMLLKFDNPRLKAGEQAKSLVFVPLKSGGQVRGILSLQNMSREHAFPQSTVQLLTTLAASMSVALENARLFDETNQRAAELAIINSVGEGLASQLDFQAIVDLVGDKVREIFKADTTYIGLFDPDANLVSVPYYMERGHRHEFSPSPPLKNFLGKLLETREAVLFGTMADQLADPSGIAPIQSPGAQQDLNETYLGVPIVVGDRVVGGVSVQSYKQHAYDKSDMRLLSTIAANMGVALENARLFDETNRLLAETVQRAAELAIINSVGEGLASKLDFQAVIDLVGDKVREIFKADTTWIGLYDAEANVASTPYYVEKGHRHTITPGPLPPSTFFARLVQQREPLIFGTMDAQTQAGGNPVESPGAGRDLNESFLGVPILIGDQVLGAVSVQRYRKHAYDKNDQRLLSTIAANMGVALENARLFDETNQRNAELAIINSVGEAMSKKLDVDTVIRIVGDRVQEIFQAEIVGIGLLDEAAGLRRLPYMYDRGARMEGDPVPMDQGLAAKVSSSRQPLVLGTAEELKQENALLVTVEGVETEPVESWLGVPIIVGEKVIGVVSVQDFKPHAYQENDARLLSTLATNMGVALENARLFDEANRLLAESRQKAAELTTVNAVSQALSSELEVGALIDMIGDQMRQIFTADIAYVALLDEQTRRIEFPYAYGEKLASLAEGEGLTGRVLQEGQPLLINREEDWLAAHGERKRIGEEALSYLGVPIKIGGRAIGVLSVQSTSESGRFDESDQRLLNTIAANVSAALRNAQLYQETQQRVSELATINVISEGLLAQQDMDAVIELVGSRLEEVLDVDGFGVALHDHRTSMFDVPFLFSTGPDGERRREQGRFKFGEGLPSRVFESGQPLMVQSWAAAQEKGAVDPYNMVRDELSWLGVPIKSGDEVHGVIFSARYKDNAFTEADLRLQATVAANLGVALRNAQLYQETQRRAEEMATLAAVGRDISQELDLDAVLEQIAVRAMSLLDGRTAVIRLLEEDGSLPAVVAIGENADAIRRDEISVGQGLTGNVVLTGKAELINEPLADPRIRVVPGTEEDEDEAIIFAPLISREKVIGVMGIWRDQPAFGPFTAADLEFSEGLARQAAIAIENARLFDEVARQKEYFESLFVNNPVAVVTVSMRGEVISWNPACQRLFGYTEEEALGQNVDDLVATHPSIEEEARTFTQRFTEELGGIHVTTRRSHKDGHLVDVEVLGLPVKVDDRVMGYIVIYHDITEIERARKAAEEANEAKSAFLANMSHELRTPLNAIIGFTRIVKRKGADVLPGRQVDNLEKVLISAEHLLGLINTVLDIAKIEAGRMDVLASTFELEPLLDLCISTSQPLLKPGVRLKKAVEGDLPPFFSDQDKVKQIVINLLSNAARFTDQGEIVVSAARQEDEMLVSVRDTGVGISPESLKRIFEEFQQVDTSRTREHGGTGLGLSISRSLAQLLGGDLTAVSTVGQGSTFTLRLPLHYDPGSAQAPGLDAQRLPQSGSEDGRPVVLVIDDHPDVIYLLKENLEEAGYRVVGALSGEEGLARARELKPFAITLDIMMPQKDGWQVLHDLKSDLATRDIPVIMVSIVDNRAMGFRLGAADYLVKPLEEGAVRAALDRITESSGGVPPRRLLVVDDDPGVIDMVRQMLEESEFVVEAAADGAAALKHLQENPPDALLLDLLMPKMDGFEVLEAMQGDPDLRDVPVVVLTAKSLPADELADLQKGVAKIIKKQGLEGEKLTSDLRQVLSRAEP